MIGAEAIVRAAALAARGDDARERALLVCMLELAEAARDACWSRFRDDDVYAWVLSALRSWSRRCPDTAHDDVLGVWEDTRDVASAACRRRHVARLLERVAAYAAHAEPDDAADAAESAAECLGAARALEIVRRYYPEVA